MSKIIMSFVFFSLLSGVSAVQALPLPTPGMTMASLPANFTASYNFEGIVALSNCSGSLVRFENSRDNDFAMVLTNGHCVESGFLDDGQIIYGKPSSRAFKLYDGSHNIAGRVNASHIIYAT
ncbi:MAG: hypothetical protein AAGB31_12745, partial [Bdellovibrio sp.]